jgi:hypothetical protein
MKSAASGFAPKTDLWLGSLPPAADLTGMAFLDFGMAKSGSAPVYEQPRSWTNCPEHQLLRAR